MPSGSPSRSSSSRRGRAGPPADPPDPARIAPSLARLARPIDGLAEDPANLRLHGERSVAAIKASLARFGQRKPIVVDAAGVTIAGAGVLRAARELGWRTVAAVAHDDLSPADRLAYGIADNRTAELSEWDHPALLAVLGGLSPADLEGTGFTAADLADLEAAGEQPTAQDEPPEPLPEAVSRAGDLWLLGEQRVLCGDCTAAADVARVMAGELAALVVTDPPYLVGYDGTNHPGGKRAAAYGVTWDDADANADLYDRFLAAAVPAVQPDAAWYTWYASCRHTLLETAWRKAGLLPHCQIVWVKNRAVPTRTWYAWRHEVCLAGFKEGHLPKALEERPMLWEHENALMGWRQGNKPERVRGQPLLSTVWPIDTLPGPERPDHPTPKPLEVYAIPFRQHTRPGDAVYEPFGGSGTAVVVGEQLRRRARAIEISPVYVDVIVRRWQKLTGRAAILEGDGRTWAELARERGVAAAGW